MNGIQTTTVFEDILDDIILKSLYLIYCENHL
jgi:hypothetical protein